MLKKKWSLGPAIWSVPYRILVSAQGAFGLNGFFKLIGTLFGRRVKKHIQDRASQKTSTSAKQFFLGATIQRKAN